MKRSMVFHRGLLETKMEEIPEVTKKLAPFAKKQSRNIIMEKKIRKRYHSEEAVKKALKIESFRNLTKDKVMEFTSMIPYMEKEVALEIIKQLYFVYVIGNHGSRIVFAADDHDRDCLNNDMGNLRVSVSGAFRKYYESDHKKQYSGYGHE